MTDKVKKIREEVEKLKSQLLRGACSSQIAMETHCKEETYNEVLSVLDTMQEEHVSNPTPNKKMSVERWKKACEAACCDSNYRSHYGLTETRDDYFVDGVQWADEHPKEEPVKRTPADIETAMQEVEEKSRFFTEAHKGEDADTILAQMRGEEPVSEDLEEAGKQYLERSNPDRVHQITNAFKAGAKWQKQQDSIVSEDFEKASKEWLAPQLDKSYANYGEAKMMELTHFDGYAMLDAIEFGANWQKAKDESITEDLGEYINKLSKQFPEVSFAKLSRIAVRVAKWQEANLWKPADGDDLPEYEREVVVFTQIFPDDAGMMGVSMGHRPNPDGWDGKNLSTGEVKHYISKTYGKGGWNIPDVKFWLDCQIPNIDED